MSQDFRKAYNLKYNFRLGPRVAGRPRGRDSGDEEDPSEKVDSEIWLKYIEKIENTDSFYPIAIHVTWLWGIVIPCDSRAGVSGSKLVSAVSQQLLGVATSNLIPHEG